MVVKSDKGIDQIEDVIDYVATGNAPYTKDQMMNTAYNIVCRTGLFIDECKAWRKMGPAAQMWTTLKKFS